MNKVYKWYAVYTRPRWEKKVADLFSRQQIENYCPLNKVIRQWSDRKKFVFEPLFRSYVFVHLTNADLSKVRQTLGVLNFVNFLGRPAVIRKEEIELIREFLDEHQSVKLEKFDIQVNDKIMVKSGPFGLQAGNVVEVRHKVIKVLLPSLGYKMTAELKKTNIKLLAKDSSIVS